MEESLPIYESVVEHLTEFIVRWKPGGIRTFVNDAYCQCFGGRKEDLIGTSFFDAISSEDRERVRKRLASLTPEQPVSIDEHQVIRADGSVGWNRWRDEAFFDHDGNLIEYQSVGQDISAQKRAEIELERMLEFQRLISELSAGFIDAAADQLDDMINRSLQAIIEHVKVDEVCLYQFDDDMKRVNFTHHCTRVGPSKTVEEREALTQRAISDSPYQWLWKPLVAGRRLVIDSVASLPQEAAAERTQLWPDETGALVNIPMNVGDRTLGFICLVSAQSTAWSDDFIRQAELLARIMATALLRQQLDTELHKSEQQLREAARMAVLGELTASIAHEINQPLTAIGANVSAARQMLASGTDCEEFKEVLTDIEADNQRVARIIREIRALVKEQPVDRHAVQWNDIIAPIKRVLEEEAGRRGGRVEFVSEETLPRIAGNETQLQQVLVNLVVNGFDAMSRLGSERPNVVVVIAGLDEEGLRISVRDYGPGFDLQRIDKFFSPLFTTKPAGLGLGLAICRRIIESHGGKIWASNHSAGGQVQFTLPIAADFEN